MRETSKLPTESLRAPNRHLSFHSQSPRAPRGDTKLAVSKILQNATESDEPLRKLVRARARGNGIPFPFSRHGLHPSSFPRRRESSLGMDCALSSFPRRRESSLGMDCALSSFPRRRRESSLGVDCALSSFPRRRESSLGIWIAPMWQLLASFLRRRESSLGMDCPKVAAPVVIPATAGIFSRHGLRPRRNGFLESPSYIPPCQ